jgi:hypothetical protein
MRLGIEKMKNIPICDLFHRATMDTIRPLLKISDGNKYVFVAINHYCKWCETWLVTEHDIPIIVKFLEDDVI